MFPLNYPFSQLFPMVRRRNPIKRVDICGIYELKTNALRVTNESADRGLTYSNLSERRSVLAIGECEADGSIINTIGHELLHVVAHICEQDGIDMMSEEPCYMMGRLCEQLFRVVQQ